MSKMVDPGNQKDPEVDEDAAGNCCRGGQGIGRADDAVALRRPARGQRLDSGVQQRRVWHRLHPPYGRSEGLPLLQQAQRDDIYFQAANNSQLQPLVGKSSYEVTFPKGQLPPAKGFWSVTVYNLEHFFYPNALNRYARGTKNKTLKYNDDGSLTIYLANQSPGKIPVPMGTFLSGFGPIGLTKPS